MTQSTLFHQTSHILLSEERDVEREREIEKKHKHTFYDVRNHRKSLKSVEKLLLKIRSIVGFEQFGLDWIDCRKSSISIAFHWIIHKLTTNYWVYLKVCHCQYY